MEAAARHARDSGRQRDEGTDNGQQAADEYSKVSPSREEAIGPIELAAAHQDPAAVALNQRAAAIAANFVGDERSEIAAKRARRSDPKQVESTLEDQVSTEGHD